MQDIKRILISRMKYIGDIVLTTPLIRAVRNLYPESYIAYLGDKESVTLLENNPNLNEIIPFDFDKPTIIEQTRVIRRLRKYKFDVFIDLFSNPRSALITRLSGAKIRIGKNVKGRGKFYTHRIRDDGKQKTAIEFHYQYVESLNVKPTCYQTEIFVTEKEKQDAINYLKLKNIDFHKPIVGLNIGATWQSKLWLSERFALLANMLVKNLSAQVVITQGSKDQSLIENISKTLLRDVKILDVLSLRKLASVLSLFTVYVTNDCGPMHIAVAVGTKTVGIFGPGDENIWFPYVPPYYDKTFGHIALRKNVECHPCHLNFCNRKGEDFMKCMKLLTMEEVFEEIKKRV